MRKSKSNRALGLALTLASCGAFAQMTPIGLWKVVDDERQQAQAYVRIGESGGMQTGKMEKLLDPTSQDAKCDKCTDERKNQPVLGMTIMRNVKSAGDGIWEGGDILDPNNGKVYRVRLKPLDGGKVLEVRGYIGPFFRNQHWLRIE